MSIGSSRGVRRDVATFCLIAISTLAAVVACTGTRPFTGSELVPVTREARAGAPGPDFASDVKPILDARCVACHACYDAPCQVKATAPEGLDRGASKAPVYHATRLVAADPTRLFVDASSTADWRDKGFFPVLGERRDGVVTPGLLRRFLELKERHPLPGEGPLPDTFSVGLQRTDECPTLEEFDGYAARHPEAGMPYGLPALADAERETLERWLEAGAPYASAAAAPTRFAPSVDDWEAFFNRPTNRGRLVARYLHEHLYQAHLYFPELSNDTWFRLIRSATPPGAPVLPIATRRPFDDPGVDTVYYRLVPERETIVAKTHNPYALDASRLARLESLFHDGKEEIDELPGYVPEGSANPFVTFEALSVEARYRFMLDEARFTIANYIRGSVCRGQIAVSVIRDRFWVVFLDPGSAASLAAERYLPTVSGELALANRDDSGNGLTPLLHWRHYERLERRHHEARDAALARWATDEPMSLELIWDGEGVNENAALTVFRHHDYASVELGLLGASPPDTAWVIDYPLLERIHYLLVADYDVYGSLGHQLTSRLHMDFLRMQGEKNLLTYVPPEARERARARWYRGAPRSAFEYLASPAFDALPFRGIDYVTDDPLTELYGLLADRLEPVRPDGADPDVELARLERLAGERTTLLAPLTLLRIEGNVPRYASILRNDAHLNMSSVFDEAGNLVPAENTLSVVPGIRGAYPNALMRVAEAELPHFVDAVLALENDADYARLLDTYGIRRTDPDFWRYSDELHAVSRADDPVEFGYLDYSRLEPR